MGSCLAWTCRSLFSVLASWLPSHRRCISVKSIISSATWFSWVLLNIPLWSCLLFLKDTKDLFAHGNYLNNPPGWFNVYFTNGIKSAKCRNAKLVRSWSRNDEQLLAPSNWRQGSSSLGAVLQVSCKHSLLTIQGGQDILMLLVINCAFFFNQGECPIAAGIAVTHKRSFCYIKGTMNRQRQRKVEVKHGCSELTGGNWFTNKMLQGSVNQGTNSELWVYGRIIR